MPSDEDVKEEALASVREGLAGLTKVPAAALAGEQHEKLVESVENAQALETELSNELDQLRERGGD